MSTPEHGVGKPTAFEQTSQLVDWSRLDSQLQKEWQRRAASQLVSQLFLGAVTPEEKTAAVQITAEIFADALAIFGIQPDSMSSFSIRANPHNQNRGEVWRHEDGSVVVKVRLDDIQLFAKIMLSKVERVHNPAGVVKGTITTIVHEIHHVLRDLQDPEAGKNVARTAEVWRRVMHMRTKVRNFLVGKNLAENFAGRWVLKQMDEMVEHAQADYKQHEEEVAGNRFAQLYLDEKYHQLKARETELSSAHAQLLQYLSQIHEEKQ